MLSAESNTRRSSWEHWSDWRQRDSHQHPNNDYHHQAADHVSRHQTARHVRISDSHLSAIIKRQTETAYVSPRSIDEAMVSHALASLSGDVTGYVPPISSHEQ